MRPSTVRAAAAVLGILGLGIAVRNHAWWPLGWISMGPLALAAVLASSPRVALGVGLLAGFAGNLVSASWLVDTIHLFGGFPWPLAALLYGLLSLGTGLQFAGFAWAVRRLGWGPLALAPALAWVSAELLFPLLFPWRISHTQRDLPVLLQIGEFTGAYGLGFVMVWTSSALASTFARGARASAPALGGAVTAVVAVVAFGLVRMPAIEREVANAPTVRVGLVQGDLSIERKGDVRYFRENIATYRQLTLEIAPEADVVIWPESVVTQQVDRRLVRLPDAWRTILGLESTPLIVGALTVDGEVTPPAMYNSVVLFDGDGRMLGVSDKQILMPFGEYMPFGRWFPFLKRLSPMTGDFQAGERVVALDVPGAGRFAALNCYEDLKSDIARAAVIEAGGEVLFAVANDAWFGDTAAAYQHEAAALWRAIETRRFLVRVTNTGVTDVIDPLGRIQLRLPTFEAKAAVETVARLDRVTFYARFGDVFAFGCLALTILGLVRGALRSR